MPRRGGPIQKRPIPHVSKVLAVASGKGGVGKSTVAGSHDSFFLCFTCHESYYVVNLAFALAIQKPSSLGRRLRVGILDLDIFGPSIPTLMGLQHADEPALTSGMLPLHCPSHPSHYFVSQRRRNVASHEPRTANHVHGVPSSTVDREQAKRRCRCCMERSDGPESGATIALRCRLARIWTWSRFGCLGDRHATGDGRRSLDTRTASCRERCVVSFLPHLVFTSCNCNQTGAVIISTPQDVALADVRRGISMFRKISVPVCLFQLCSSYTDQGHTPN